MNFYPSQYASRSSNKIKTVSIYTIRKLLNGLFYSILNNENGEKVDKEMLAAHGRESFCRRKLFRGAK